MKLKSTAIALLLGLSANAFALIPVTDGAHISTNVANQIQTWLLEAEKWTERVSQIERDFENQKAQLSAVTGITDMSGFMDKASSILGNVSNLDKWLGNQDEILRYGYEILSPELKSVFDSYGLDNLCKNLNDTQRKNCEGDIVIDVVKQEQVKRDLSRVKERVNTINDIAMKMKGATTTKQAQDLSNAMQTQIALLQADKIAHDIAKSSEELAEKKSQKLKADELRRISQNKDFYSNFGQSK